MAVEGSNLEQARQDSDIMLKRRTVESSRAPASFDTPRASSASSVPSSTVSVRSTPTAKNREKPTKYVSQMAKAREEKKRSSTAAGCESSSDCKSSSSDMETSSNPSSTETTSSSNNSDKLSNLPKFGEWEKHSANSGPCYTLLFQNAAQEKKIGGPIRVHAPLPAVRNEDLYPEGINRAACVKKPPRKRKSHGLLSCCFKSSESS